MNLARAAAADKKRIIVAEGYADVVQLAQAGFAESVAAMGTAVSQAQARKIAAAAANIFFAMDGDDAGRAAAVKSLAAILPHLADGQSVHFVFLPTGEDPDSFIREKGAAEFEYLLAAAPPLAEFIVQHLQGRPSQPADSDARRAAFLQAGAKLIRLLDADKAPFMRDILTARIAESAGVVAKTVAAAAASPILPPDRRRRPPAPRRYTKCRRACPIAFCAVWRRSRSASTT